MKRDGYPEDSTQSAYSSQLIWIPLSHLFFFFFYLWGFISREATKRQYRGGDHNQLLGEMPADVRKYVLLPHFRLKKLSASDIRTSRAAFVFPLMQTFSALSQFVAERANCLARLANRAASTVSTLGLLSTAERRKHSTTQEALDQQNNANWFFKNVPNRIKGIFESQFSSSVNCISTIVNKKLKGPL